MTRRPHRGDPEMIGTADLGPLFHASSSTAAGIAALEGTAAKHEADIQRLVPLARELAATARPHGIMVSDLRVIGTQRGLLTGRETGRQLSYLGKVMERAGLAPTGEYQRSVVVRSHGNLQMTWKLP